MIQWGVNRKMGGGCKRIKAGFTTAGSGIKISVSKERDVKCENKTRKWRIKRSVATRASAGDEKRSRNEGREKKERHGEAAGGLTFRA